MAQSARTHVGAGFDLDVHRCQRLRDIFLLVVPAHPALRWTDRAGHGHFRVLGDIYLFAAGPAAGAAPRWPSAHTAPPPRPPSRAWRSSGIPDPLLDSYRLHGAPRAKARGTRFTPTRP